MPHHPSEEHAPDNLTDKIAQHSKDSTASDHPMHDENKGPVEQAKPRDFEAAGHKGPQIPDGDMPPTKGKAELEAETKKLNSK